MRLLYLFLILSSLVHAVPPTPRGVPDEDMNIKRNNALRTAKAMKMRPLAYNVTDKKSHFLMLE